MITQPVMFRGYQPNKVGSEKVELAHWGSITEKRQKIEAALTPNRIMELAYTRDEGAVIPLNPIFTKAEFPSLPWKTLQKVSLFTFTTKMSCASFSIAAGPLFSKGTCLASNMNKDAAVRVSRQIEEEGGFGDSKVAAEIGHRGPKLEKSIASSRVNGLYICDACYAGKGRYSMYMNISLCQFVRKVWADRALARGTFVSEMVDALSKTLGDSRLMTEKLASGSHFRIHDSGDFYSLEYMAAWFGVCAQMPNVQFWAPTRMWVSPEFRQLMKTKPTNLALRPSALFYGTAAPLVPGMSGGSSSSTQDLPGHWTCPAYLSADQSCASAGCRTCWDRQEVPVNYKTH